jgi:hypothetical protein
MKVVQTLTVVLALILCITGEGFAYSFQISGGQLNVHTNTDVGMGGDLSFNIGDKVTEYVTAAIISLSTCSYNRNNTQIGNVSNLYGTKAIRFQSQVTPLTTLDIIQNGINDISIKLPCSNSPNKMIRLYPTANETIRLQFDYIFGILVKLITGPRQAAGSFSMDISISSTGTGDAIIYTLETNDITF